MARRVKVPTRSSRVRHKTFRKAGKNSGVKVPITDNVGTKNRHLKVSSNNPFRGSISG